MQSGLASINAPVADRPAPAQPAAPPQETPVGPVQAVVSKPAKPVPLRRKLAYELAVVLLLVLGGAAWWWFHRPVPAYRVQDPGIYPFQGLSADGKTTKWGFIDADGNVLVQPEWDAVGEGYVYGQAVFCTEGRCGIRRDGKDGYIDYKGRLVVKNQFDLVGPFIEGLAWVQLNNRTGYINKAGQYVINPQFSGARDFHEGLAAVHVDSGWGFINKAGQFVIKPTFQSVTSDFSDGLAGVCLDSKCGYISNKGIAINRRYADGRTENNFIYEYAGTFSEDLAPVQSEGKWRYIDKSESDWFSPSFEGATTFAGGFAVIEYKGVFGTFNQKVGANYFDSPISHLNIQISESDLLKVSSSDGVGLITRDGKWVVMPSKVLTDIEAIYGKVFSATVAGQQWVPVSISGKVLAGPHKGAMLDSLARNIDNEKSAPVSMRAPSAPVKATTHPATGSSRTVEAPAKTFRSEVHLPGGIYRFSGTNVVSQGIRAQFEVHLYKQDGWFNTGIPIASQLFLNLNPTPDTRWVQLMIGNTIIDPPDPKTSLYLRLSANEVGPRTPGLQNVIIPETTMFQPLKVRVSTSADAPDEVHFFIRLIDRGVGAGGGGELSEIQKREEQELMKWEGR